VYCETGQKLLTAQLFAS